MSIPKIPKIRTLNGKIVRRNGRIAASDDCCCEPCEMTAVVLVSWECPCGGFGGADSETAVATFTLVTKDGHDLIYGSEWPSYIHSGSGSNSITLTGGETSASAGYYPPENYEPGESRIEYTGPCGKEIFDENGVRILYSSRTFGGIEFSKSWDAATRTWTYHYRIKNGVLYNTGTGALEPVKRPVRLVVSRGACCWNGDPEDPIYASQDFLVGDARRTLRATRVSANGNVLSAVFDGGTTVRLPVCDGANADTTGLPSIEIPDDSGEPLVPRSAGCCKDPETGDVYYCVTFECDYGAWVSYTVHVDVPASNCGCQGYLESIWRYYVDAMFSGGADGFAIDIRCRDGNWGQPSITGSFPDYLIGVHCCCSDCSAVSADVSFRNSSGADWDGARFEVSGTTVTITPRIPITITVPVTYCDGTAATADECNGLPPTLEAHAGDETIVLALSGSTYSGTGFVDCTSSAPTVYISTGEGGSSVWRYGYPSISSVTCDPYEGWMATGEAHPIRRSFTLELVLDATPAYANGGDCVHPMYGINAVVDGRYILQAYSDNETATITVTSCGEDPSCDLSLSSYWRGNLMTAELDTTNQPGIALYVNSGLLSGAPYSASWNASTNTLTLTWKVVCDADKSIAKVPIPNACAGRISYSAGWIKGSDWIFVGDARNWPSHPPQLCDCLAVLDWPSVPTTMTCSVGYPAGTTVYITVNDTNGWWALAQANGITDFSCYGTIDGHSIRFTYDAYGRMWTYSGSLPASATSAPAWTFWGPVYDWSSGTQSVPSVSGTLVCSSGFLTGGGSV